MELRAFIANRAIIPIYDVDLRSKLQLKNAFFVIRSAALPTSWAETYTLANRFSVFRRDAVQTLVNRFLLLVAFALLCVCTLAPAAKAGAGATDASSPAFKTVQNPSGGTIVYGAVPGQQTYKTVLSVMLKRVEADYGDRPQLGNMLQSRNGNFWEGFFAFANKKQGGSAPMTGMVVIYAPQSGTAGGATMIDTTANFPKTANSMVQTLVHTIQSGSQGAQKTTTGATSTPGSSAPPSSVPGSSAPASSAPAASATGAAASGPAQKLTPYAFPDGTGAVSLPAGWKPTSAHMGDVIANGPNGEALRFGFVVEALDPNLPSSRSLRDGRGAPLGSFVLVPYNEDPVKIYQDTVNQLSQKQHLPGATFTVQQTQDLHASPGKNFVLFGTLMKSGASTPSNAIIQLVCSPENQLGFEIKIFQITAPEQVFKQETATLNAIFPTYTSDPKLISQMATANARAVIQADNNTIAYERQLNDASERSTQGISDMLRDQSVFVDSSTGQHYRGPDDLASALQNANPNRFTTLSLGQYISGVDY